MKIFKKQIAEELIKQGFKLKKTEPNKKYPTFLTFVFYDVPELFDVLKDKYGIVVKKI